MQVGRFTIEQLNEGQFEFFPDGRINRTPVSEIEEVQAVRGLKRQLVGINPLYVSDSQHHILLDTGLGWGLDAGSGYSDISNICTNLDIFGIAPSDITHVILTHLHYDHVAGSSFTGPDASTRPTFSNATYIVQQSEWEFAIQQSQANTTDAVFYRLDDLYRLYSDRYLHLIDADKQEIIPGVEVIRTGGHTPGHQIVKITDDGNTAYFAGDLISVSGQLNYSQIPAHHINQLQTKKMATHLLRNAYHEEALFFLYHSLSSKPCRLYMDKEKNYVLKELD